MAVGSASSGTYPYFLHTENSSRLPIAVFFPAARSCSIFGNFIKFYVLPAYAHGALCTDTFSSARADLEHFQFETLCVSNYTAYRFAEKARFFRSVRAGRRCAAALRFTKLKRSNEGDSLSFIKGHAGNLHGQINQQYHRL
ncbi:hypothetical protein [Desulfovibrio piger]|uniref:Uncharacterized protein n=1 Tax=Desulfovibrio piger TaxID=901 RepID=A0A848CBP4_9BACT|nr:hypothetical protein [Desulfovibrio piger]NME52662.1 hypothetical protein [Desulfovibrio piger]